MPTFFLLLRSIYVSMSKNYLLPLFLSGGGWARTSNFPRLFGNILLDGPNLPLFIPSTGTRVFLLLFATLYIFYLPSSLIPSQSASRFPREFLPSCFSSHLPSECLAVLPRVIISIASYRRTAPRLCSSLSGVVDKPTVSLSSLRSSASPSRASSAGSRRTSPPSPL